MRDYRTGPKNPYHKPTKTQPGLSLDVLHAVKDRGGEWIVRNQRGHVIASGFDSQAEALAFIGDKHQ